jgi:amino acid adenylation domain-containing protein
LSKREGATLFMTLLAAFLTLLYRHTGQDDIVVGSPIAGRNRRETEELIGFFINTLALRTDLSGEPTFTELLGRVRETAVGAYAHQDLPFEKLVEELQPERDLNRNPFFQTMFQFQNSSRFALELHGLRVKSLEVATETAKFDLMLAALEENDHLTLVMEYSTDLFAAETIGRMLQQLSTLLESIAANPNERISRLPLMTEIERDQLLNEWNATEAGFPRDRCLHQVFEERVAQAGEMIALIFGNDRVTFDELNARANQLAHYLKRSGVGAETRVAICLERSPQMITTLLAIMKAGGVYVPLEANFPQQRMSFIVEDSQAEVIVTSEKLHALLPACSARVVLLDRQAGLIAAESKENPTNHIMAENAAHVIYTSGSTGKPKGVVSSHRASLNRFAWMWHEYPFSAEEVCCQKTSLSFVDSIWEIFGPLLHGVPLAIIPDEVVKNPLPFVRSLEENRVTRLVLVPSLLRVLLERDDLARRLYSLKYCVCSGETLPAELATAFRQLLPNTRLINLYGSSEVAADVTCYEVDAPILSAVPIGRPIANTRVYVLDQNFEPAAIGVPGEVFVGGEGLARGYLDKPDLTADRFMPDRFANEPGLRLFRTGDRGRYLADGNIEYLGRRDHQVKIRGFRIELGEIEAALSDHPQVQETVVVAAADERGERFLAAYVVLAEPKPTANDLRGHLQRRLPDYMTPSLFVVLEALPLTASGKVDRLALPKPDRGQSGLNAIFQEPRNPTEQLLAEVWAATLGCERISIHDDFFSLGGHSLLLARIASRIHDVFGVELPLRTLFAGPTVAEMSMQIESARSGRSAATDDPIVPVLRSGRLPLSYAQERLWFFDQIEAGSAAYNIPRAFRLRGSLDVTALKCSLNVIVARHEVLRCRFLTKDGQPELLIDDAKPLELRMRHATGANPEQLQQLIREETSRPFDLGQDHLLRLTLWRVDETDHLLALTMHHIISDGWSVGVFLRELVTLYNAFISGDTPALPDLPVQYLDYAAWQRRGTNAPHGQLQQQFEFWRRQLAGVAEVIDLPADRPRPPVRSFQGAKQAVSISRETSAGLLALCRAERVTLFMALLGAFQVLLSSLNGQEEIVVGSPTAGRNRRETESLIGYFVNTLVMRTDLSHDPGFREVLTRVRRVALDAYANQDVPFAKLVEELRPARTLSHNPLFQAWFVLQNAPGERSQWQDLEATAVAVESATTRHDLQLTLWEEGDVIEGAFTYSTDLFDADTVARISEQFTRLLELAVTDPNIKLSDLRERLNEVGRDFELRAGRQIEEASRQRLRMVKRREVSDKL